MDIDTSSVKLKLNNSKVIEKNEKWIEQDVIIPDNMPDAIKIINVCSRPYVNDVEINNNRIKVVGKICYNIIYMADEEKMHVRGLDVSCPYSISLESSNIKNKEDIIISSYLKNIIYSLPNERKIAIKNEVCFETEIVRCHEVNILKEFNNSKDIECNKCKSNFLNVVASKKLNIASSDDVMLKSDAKAMYEILKIEARIIDTDYKVSYNKLMLKGVLEIKITYLGEKGVGRFEKVCVPFSSMIEMDNITDKSKFNIRYNIRDLNVKINPDIDQKTLNVEYKIEAFVQMYENETVEYINDFYSRSRALNYSINEENVITDIIYEEKEINIIDSFNDVLEDGVRIIESSIDTSNLVLVLDANNIKVSGIAKLNLLVQNTSSLDIENRTLDIMVDTTIPIEKYSNNTNVGIRINDVDLVVTQNGRSIDIKVVIKLDVTKDSILNIESVGKIEDGPLDVKNISSINIYVVKKGDSIWKIAKKYKTSMDNIIKTNNIENPNQINEGQKILVIR